MRLYSRRPPPGAGVGRYPRPLLEWTMEALFFLIDSLVMIVLVYYGVLDERRPRNAPMRSPFRYFEGGRTSEVIAQQLAQEKLERARGGRVGVPR